MRTLKEVTAAVGAGEPATEDELRFAVHLLATWAAFANGTMLVVSGSRGSTHLSVPDHQRIRMAFDAHRKWQDMDLDNARGTVFEPGILPEEHKRLSDIGLVEMIGDGNTVLGLDRETEEP